MNPPLLQSHAERFAERNAFLHLAVGVLSYGERLDRLLERYAPPGGPPAPAAPSSPDQAAVAFVLGLIAFRDRAMSALECARAGAPDPAPRGPAPRLPRTPGLLR